MFLHCVCYKTTDSIHKLSHLVSFHAHIHLDVCSGANAVASHKAVWICVTGKTGLQTLCSFDLLKTNLSVSVRGFRNGDD